MKNRGGKQRGKQLGKTEADTLAGTTLQPRPPPDQRLWKKAERTSKGERLLLCGPRGCWWG